MFTLASVLLQSADLDRLLCVYPRLSMAMHMQAIPCDDDCGIGLIPAISSHSEVVAFGVS